MVVVALVVGKKSREIIGKAIATCDMIFCDADIFVMAVFLLLQTIILLLPDDYPRGSSTRKQIQGKTEPY